MTLQEIKERSIKINRDLRAMGMTWNDIEVFIKQTLNESKRKVK